MPDICLVVGKKSRRRGAPVGLSFVEGGKDFILKSRGFARIWKNIRS